MQQDTLDHLLATVEVKLNALAICEIGHNWRLSVDPQTEAVCHFVMRGRGFLEFAGRRVPISAGSILIVPPGTAKSLSGENAIEHEIDAGQSCFAYKDGMLAFRAADGEPSLLLGCASVAAAPGGGYGLFHSLTEPMAVTLAGNDDFTAGFRALSSELADPRIGGRTIAECLMKQALILLLREQLQSTEHSALLAQLGDRRIVRAASAMMRNPEKPHDLSSLADLCGMSRSSFLAHFLREYGTTPGSFLRSARMSCAARLLATMETPVKAVAAAVGYSSRSQFSRSFRSAFGEDPSSYRKLQRRRAAEGEAASRTSATSES